MSKKKHIETLVRGLCAVDGHILLCHTKGSSNTYLPGGHVEFDEMADHALVREIDEELGLEASAGAFLGAIEHKFVQKEKLHCEINLVFLMAVKDVSADTVPASMEDYIEFCWLAVAELENSNLEPAPLRALIPKWLTQQEDSSAWSSTFD